MDKWGCGALQLDEDGFKWNHPKQVGSILWSDVRTIRAFKRDLLVYDLICVAFELNDDTFVEIHEHMDGFMTVIKAVQKHFNGIDSDWYRKIMLPVFEPTETLLWSKNGP